MQIKTNKNNDNKTQESIISYILERNIYLNNLVSIFYNFYEQKLYDLYINIKH